MSSTKPRILLIHGSAADHTTWSIQVASKLGEELRERFDLIAYDRRRESSSVEAHADDAIARLDGDEAPALVCGSSFGAVVALDAVRRHGARFAGAILLEPPMAPSDTVAPEQLELLVQFDRRRAEQGDEAAAELFLRTVLGDPAYERMPKTFQDRSKSMAAQIRSDSAALVTYRPRYAELRSVRTPVQLVGGERSAAYFRPTLDALFAVLPDARLEILAGAGHMMHAEAHKKFGELLIAFGRDTGLLVR
jgi:pimeloyl-ACP methyl ester carboxylesterase